MICRLCDLAPGIRLFGRRLKETANLMVGLPDYDTYVGAPVGDPSGPAGDDAGGILPRAPGAPLRRRRRRLALLLKGRAVNLSFSRCG